MRSMSDNLAFVATKQVAFVYRAKSLVLLFHDFGGNAAQEVQSEMFKLADIKTLKQAILWLCPQQL